MQVPDWRDPWVMTCGPVYEGPEYPEEDEEGEQTHMTTALASTMHSVSTCGRC